MAKETKHFHKNEAISTTTEYYEISKSVAEGIYYLSTLCGKPDNDVVTGPTEYNETQSCRLIQGETLHLHVYEDNYTAAERGCQEHLEGDIDDNTKSIIEKSIKDTRIFVKEVERFLHNRRFVVSSLRDLADTLKGTSENALHLSTDSVSFVEEYAPFTTERDEFEEAPKFKKKVDEMEKTLNEDMNMMRRVDEMFSNLSSSAESLSQSNSCLGSRDQILCSLLVADTFSNMEAKVDSSFKSATAVFTMLCTRVVKRTSENQASSESFELKIASYLLPRITCIFNGGMATRAKDVMSAVFGTIAEESSSSKIGCDISELVFPSMRLKGGSKSETAKLVQVIAEGYEKLMIKTDDLFSYLVSLAEDLEVILKKQFLDLLECISNKTEFSSKDLPKTVTQDKLRSCEREYTSKKSGDEGKSEVCEDSKDERYKKAVNEARTLLNESRSYVKNRQATVSVLSDIANELEALSDTDSVTVQNLAEEGVLKTKVKEAQTLLNADKQSMATTDHIYASLKHDAENLSRSTPDRGHRERIMSSLLIANTRSLLSTKVNSSIKSTTSVSTLILSDISEAEKTGNVSDIEKIVYSCTPIMIAVFSQGVLKSSQNVVESFLHTDAKEKSAELSFNIQELVHTLVDLSQGSNSEAARILRDIVQRYKEQLMRMSEFLQLITNLAKDLESILKQQFQDHLENISEKDPPEKTDVDKTREFLDICAQSDRWTYTQERHITSWDTFVHQVARIFKFLKQKIDDDHEQRMDTGDVMDLTFLAHGHVRRPLRPSSLNYMNGHIDSVLLYVPWGCFLHATAAWGIATGIITPENVTYTPNMVIPGPPDRWNTLPNDYTRIPDVVFTPLEMNQSIYTALRYISHRFQYPLRGLVIPFFQEPAGPRLPHDVELWALCASVGVCAWSFGVTYRIHIASCLYPNDIDPADGSPNGPNNTRPLLTDDIFPPYITVNCENYCAVPVVAPPCIMAMELPVTDEEIEQHIRNLNSALGIPILDTDVPTAL